jgi:PAS domain S-box-containing protein
VGIVFGLGRPKQQATGAQLAGDLNDERLRFEVIVNAIDDGVILVDRDQVVQMINPGGAKITDWTAEEATGISVFNILKFIDDKGEPLHKDENPFTKVFKQQQSLRENTIQVMDRNGKQLCVSLSMSPLFDDKKQITAAVAIFRDVSKERAEERQRGDFISTASHEMRTPVAAIEGYLALALNEKVSTVDARARDYIEKAHESTKHLGQLFQDLLTSSKAEDGRLTSHPEVVEIGEFLEKVSEDLRFSAEKKGLYTEFKVGSSNTIDASKSDAGGGVRTVRPLYYAYVDADRLREVVTNLFDNAVKYTPEGKVTLGINGDDSVVQCYVKDTGPGIPAADVPHLFQKFYRVDNSATRTIGGTGLGLFICRKIIELYNGRIWVESEEGKGSSFYINLPRLSNQRVQELRAATAAESTNEAI